MTKTILSIGYYDDFARFFLKVKKEFLQKDESIKFNYFSIHLSGYLYFLFKFQKVSFLSLRVWINSLINHKGCNRNILIKKNIYKEINLNNLIRYHSYLNPNNIDKLKKQAISYIDFYENYLLLNKPDVIILSGDTRMSVEILDILAKKNKIKTFYFEQGPFGTTIMDHQGVNANTSIRSKKIRVIDSPTAKSNVESFLSRTKSPKYKRNPLYRFSDIIYQLLFFSINLVPPDIYIKSQKIGRSYFIANKVTTWGENKNIFLLILQVPYDANMVMHSPHFKDHFTILKNIYENLPANSQLIVREHPLFIGKYESELYEFIKEKRISIDTKNLNQSLKDCSVIIVNNSTVGIEAISKLKTVVVLGNSYYDNHGISLKLNDKKYLKELLIEALNFKLNPEKVYSFFDFLIQDFLIQGHFRDKDLTAAEKIVNKITRIRYGK